MPRMTLNPHDKVLIDGQLVEIGEDIARRFSDGDLLLAPPSSGLLLVPKAESDLVLNCIEDALRAFSELSNVAESQITDFYSRFAERLEDEEVFSAIRAANDVDVATANAAGRSITRLVLSDSMRQDMIDALRIWETVASSSAARETVVHDGWSIESHSAPDRKSVV